MSKKTIRTIEDIALLANVSKSTVSRALNDSKLISQDTRERIQSIAREHNFRINAPARNLSRKCSCTIAFVTHSYQKKCYSVEDLFGLEIMGGIANELDTLGYEMLVAHINPQDIDWAQDYLDSGRVDGFIVMTSARKMAHIKALMEINAPFIVWGAPDPKNKYCSVTGDNLTGGTVATDHLIKGGRQRIGFIGGPADDGEVLLRYRGYEEALQAAGMQVEPKRLVYGDYSHSSGLEAMKRLLDQAPDIDAVFACSDLMAVAAINVIQANGKRVPEDIAIVGYDDVSIAGYNNLPLTTVRQNIPMASRLLAQNLIQRIQTGVITSVTIPVELVVRKSA